MFDAICQVISAASTTGWQTSNIADWNPAVVIFIVAPFMIIGGSAGATVGGVKLRVAETAAVLGDPPSRPGMSGRPAGTVAGATRAPTRTPPGS